MLSKQGVETTVLRLLTVAPLPVEAILSYLTENSTVVVVEESMRSCGIREQLQWELTRKLPNLTFAGIDLGKEYVTHGSMQDLYSHYGLDGESISKYVQEVLSE